MVNPQFRKFPQRMGYVCKNIKSFQLTQNMGIFNYMKGKIILCLKFISYMDLKKKIIIPPSENSGLCSTQGFRERRGN